jgi:CRP-like cAMP-binding protein
MEALRKIFKDVHPLTLNNICYDFKEAKLPKNTVLFKEGEEAKFLYLVIEGEVEVCFLLKIKIIILLFFK